MIRADRQLAFRSFPPTSCWLRGAVKQFFCVSSTARESSSVFSVCLSLFTSKRRQPDCRPSYELRAYVNQYICKFFLAFFCRRPPRAGTAVDYFFFLFSFSDYRTYTTNYCNCAWIWVKHIVQIAFSVATFFTPIFLFFCSISSISSFEQNGRLVIVSWLCHEGFRQGVFDVVCCWCLFGGCWNFVFLIGTEINGSNEWHCFAWL